MNQPASQRRRENEGEEAGGGWGANSEEDNGEDSMTEYGAIDQSSREEKR